MKKTIFLACTLAVVICVEAGDLSASNQVKQAITKLQGAPNFSWTSVVKMPDSPFEPGPLHGHTEKGGYTVIKQDMGENTLEAVFKGKQIVLKQDGEWRLPRDVDGFLSMMAGLIVRNGTAADEADNFLKKAKELKAGDGSSYEAEFTEEGAKTLLTFGPTPPKRAEGSIKFWLKDGGLDKFESHLKGTVQFGQDGEDREFEMTRTFEIQEVGRTKVDVPAEAKAKLDPKQPEKTLPTAKTEEPATK